MVDYLITHTEGETEVSANHIVNAISMFLSWNNGVDPQDILTVQKL